jgi:hypothetical protein
LSSKRYINLGIIWSTGIEDDKLKFLFIREFILGLQKTYIVGFKSYFICTCSCSKAQDLVFKGTIRSCTFEHLSLMQIIKYNIESTIVIKLCDYAK